MKVNELLQLKAEQVNYASQILLEKTRDWQVIRQFMITRHEEIILTPAQQKKLDRYQFIYNQLVSGKYTDQDVVHSLTNLKLFAVSLQQAYEDLRCARELFNSVININKLFEINNELQIAKSARNKCLEIHDYKNFGIIGKNINKLLEMLPDEEDHPGLDFEGHIVEAVFDPILLGAPKTDMMEVIKLLNDKKKVTINFDKFEHLDIIEPIYEKETSL